jgi:hypothetical protein
MGSTPIYNIPFAEPSDLVRDWPSISEQVALAVEAALEDIPVREKRIAAFTGSGTWTVPAGVTYAIAHMLGGGGGAGFGGSVGDIGGNGGDSSVAFASGTVTALGGFGSRGEQTIAAGTSRAARDNSGEGALGQTQASAGKSGNGNHIVAGAAVTPAASISVTVGAGGTSGLNGAAGGSGYVYIEYYEEV